MWNRFKIEARVSIACKECDKRTEVPALKVVPGVKCQHCGKELAVDNMAYAVKMALLLLAGHRDDVDFG